MESQYEKKYQPIYPRLAMNKRQISQRQGKFCICFIFDLKRLSDSEFFISKGMFCQIWGPLKVIALIPYFIVDLCLDAGILRFLKPYTQSFVWNTSFIIGGDKPFKNL